MKKMVIPFASLFIIIALDYITKFFVVNGYINETNIIIGTLFELTIANNAPINSSIDLIKYIFPFSVILLTIIFTLKSNKANSLERLCLFSIIGGILGNLIFNNNFISIKLFVELPFNNIADFSVILFSIIIMLSILITDRRIIK